MQKDPPKTCGRLNQSRWRRTKSASKSQVQTCPLGKDIPLKFSHPRWYCLRCIQHPRYRNHNSWQAPKLLPCRHNRTRFLQASPQYTRFRFPIPRQPPRATSRYHRRTCSANRPDPHAFRLRYRHQSRQHRTQAFPPFSTCRFRRQSASLISCNRTRSVYCYPQQLHPREILCKRLVHKYRTRSYVHT